MSIRRPGREDTDDDLLRLQEEFLAKKETPSVNIKNNVLRSSKLPSDVKFDFESLKNSATSDTTRNFPHDKIPVPEEMLNILSTNSNTALNQSSNISSGIQSQHKNSGPPKRKSLFALRMEKSRADAKTASTVIEDKSTASGSQFGDHSYIISGKEANEIHQQNVAQLESLSVSEIEQERKRLMSQLSSSTVKFLQSRRKNVVLSNEKLKVTHENVNLEHPAKENICEDKVPVQHVQKNKVFSSSFSSMQLNDEVKGTNEDLLDTLPINPNEAKEWLHMDVIEKEKLEWMKSLPPVKSKPAPDEAYSARFDFQGVLLPFNDEELDVNKGLHHHGDEPERPGYTLQELIQLSRSSVLQQRTMGLNTIGNILLKTKLGIYDKVLQQSIIKELLDVGVFLLFRFSMDDTSPSVVIAALTAMRNLLYNEPDEAGLDFLLGCEGGLQNPVLDIPVEEGDAKKIQEQKDYEAELKDFEIIQLDVLKGAERTNLILRLGYILDVIKGPPDVVLDLLVRIARHSRQLGEGVASCGGLLRTIRDQLLTTQVIPSLVAGVGQPGYGEPSSKALRLIRVLAAQSRTIANTLIEKFNIMEPIMTYVSMSSPELPHIQSLVVHGFYLWQTFLCYGLTSECILDLFPILMRQLHYHVQVTSATGEGSSASGHELATALAGVIEKGCEITSSDIKVLDAKPVFQLANLIVDCLHKWFSQLNSDFSEVPSWSCVKMIGSALNCLTSILLCAKNQDTIDSKSIQKRLETLAHDSIFPFLKSVCLQKLLENLMSSSFFLGNGENGTRRDPPNLPSLGAIEWGGENLVPGLLLKSPYPLISGLMRFLGAYCTVFSTSSKKELQTILLDNKHLDEYIQAFVTRPLRSSNHWFCRQEVYMLHHLLVLVVLQPSLVPDNKKPKFTHLALRILDLIQANDKYLISRLLPITIFNTEFVRWGMSQHSEREKSVNSAVEECLDGLSSIGSLYLSMLGLRFLKVLPPSLRTSLTSLSRGTEPALPIDWLFAPLLVFYGQYNAQNRARYLEADTISMVTETLQFLFLMETLWPISRRPLSVTARWCRLALVFLAGSDLFLDDDVRKYLRMNLNNLLLQRHKLNFSESIPGLSSFYDLYGELLLQFSAISYGDKLFGAFILLPLQQKQDPQLRRMIWGENAVVLRVLSTSVDEVGVPLDEFLTPTETDASLLTSYLEAIAKGHIIEERCPLIFKIAVHHVATFIQEQGGHPLAVSLKKSIDCIANKAIQELFLNYHSPTAL